MGLILDSLRLHAAVSHTPDVTVTFVESPNTQEATSRKCWAATQSPTVDADVVVAVELGPGTVTIVDATRSNREWIVLSSLRGRAMFGVNRIAGGDSDAPEMTAA